MEKKLAKIIQTTVNVTDELILKLIGLIDLTTLNNVDTEATVLQLVDKANKGICSTHPAAVCVFSNFGELVRLNLNSTIKCAVVGGCFPTGQSLAEAKVKEVEIIAKTAANEIDVVLNRGDLFSERYAVILEELQGMKKATNGKLLKVILETGDLNAAQIEKGCTLALEANADFIKTSTGKTTGATPQAAYIICQCIKKHYEKTGVQVGFKPSGGIRTLDDAILYYLIVGNVLGEEWLTPTLFRIGASSLYDNLIENLTRP